MKNQPTFAIIDVETTGGSSRDERITEVAILVHNGKRVIEKFSSLVNPQKPIDPFVVALTGISDEMVKDAPTFEEILKEVDKVTKDRIFVAHNVRFDYGMFKKEYRRVGVPFQRKQLCTVRLSKKFFPNLPSYSLGKLCDSLEIKLDNRHRAFGDAEATAILFEKMLMNGRRELIHTELNEGLKENLLPPKIKMEDVKSLPEEVGVYYFLDEQGRKLYIGKSKNIRQRVISHFGSDLNDKRYIDLKNKMASIHYELTGNELVALLLESDEIKRWMPAFNKAQRRRKYRYGVFLRKDEFGFDELKVETLNLEEIPIMKYTSRRWASVFVEKIRQDNGLFITGALVKKLKENGNFANFKKNHNRKLRNAIKPFLFPSDNFFLIEEGREYEENALIWVEENEYKGFGYVKDMNGTTRPDELSEHITFYRDNPEVQSIIRKWIKKHKQNRLIKY